MDSPESHDGRVSTSREIHVGGDLAQQGEAQDMIPNLEVT